MLFDKQITEDRFNEVISKLRSFSWYPQQTNAFELYRKNGSVWSKIPTSDLASRPWLDSWKDMPKTMIEYISSLSEFDATIFKEITGLEGVDSKKQELLKKADEKLEKIRKILLK